MRKFIYITLFLLISTLQGSVMAQPGSYTSKDADFIAISSNNNFDSLLNSYYMRKYAASVNQHYTRRTTMFYDSFDMIPDSVFEARLKALKTVVPLTFNRDVRSYIKFYSGWMERKMDVILTLSEYYFPMFEEILNRYNVPEEFKYLTIVESALNPTLTSKMGAAGLWQFMYSTGKRYDLEVNSLVDDRRDPYKSTVAAARYLRDLHKIYNDWILAMAAYNCGPGNVNKAISRSGGQKTFWQIYQYLPKETRGYIPAYIGVTYIMNYYHEHGLHPKKINLPINSDTIHLNHDVLYAMVNKFVGIDIEELRTLNPQYRTDFIPASSGKYTICIPASKVKKFIEFEDSIYRSTRDSINRKPVVVETTENVVQAKERIIHKVKRGETMGKIANKYGVSISNIKKWNKKKSTTVQLGEHLIIYKNNPNYVPPKTKEQTPQKSQSSTASNSETESVVSSKPEDPRDNDPIESAVASNSKPIRHTVQKGETLSSLSREYNIPITQIKETNNLKSDNIKIGQVLIIKK